MKNFAAPENPQRLNRKEKPAMTIFKNSLSVISLLSG